MVNGFIVEQTPQKQFLCHEYVFELIRPTRGSRLPGARIMS